MRQRCLPTMKRIRGPSDDAEHPRHCRDGSSRCSPGCIPGQLRAAGHHSSPAELKSFQELIQPLLVEHDVKLEIVCPSGAVLRTEMRPENFHCLLQILAANAMDWLKGVSEPRIRIELQHFPDVFELLFADNGPGIPRGVGDRIFEPLFSRKEGGRGMGLTIARQMLEGHGGSIDILLDGRRKGANFVVTLPRKRSRATIYENGAADGAMGSSRPAR
jgi:C4-dicarboxylate-specific signal transduction histidine kinase